MQCYGFYLLRDYINLQRDELLSKKNVISVKQRKTFFEIKAYIQKASYYNNQGRSVLIASNSTEDSYLFSVQNIVSFIWSKNSFTIEYILHQNGSIKLLNYWLLHIFLPVYFSIKQHYFFLHVGSVMLKDAAIAFSAPCNGGKSTLTNFFMQQGHTLITDDKLGTYIDGKDIICVPSYPYHRPYRETETIGKYVENFSKKSQRLKTIYQINQVDAKDNITILELKGVAKFTQLKYASELNYIKDIINETQFIADLAKRVQMYIVNIPWDISRLNEVYDAIISHQNELGKPLEP